MSAPRPVLDEPVRAALDEIAHPISIAMSLRDPGGLLVDFRILFVNAAGAAWSGQPREAIVGRQVGELLPALRTSGLFDEAWQDIGDGHSQSDALDRTLRRSHALIRLIRLESRARPRLRPAFAT